MQLAIPAWDLRHTPFHFTWSLDWRHPGVRRVLLLMLPVTISLGLINFNALINSFFGALVSEQAPAAIDKAFRLYQLPQGIFSVAIATVLFPTLARFANAKEFVNLRATLANGMRQILFVLLPATARDPRPLDPIIRLVYQRGEFDPDGNASRRHRPLLVRLLAADQRRLPAADADLLQPPAALAGDGAGGDRPGRLGGSRRGALQAVRGRRDRRRDRDRDQRRGLRPGLHPAPQVRRAGARTPALDRDPDLDRLRRRWRPSAGWSGTLLDERSGEGTRAQIVSLGTRPGVGGFAYLAVARLLRIAELEQIMRLLLRRRRA